MKQERYNVGDRVKFERTDYRSVQTCHIKEVCVHEMYYIVDWYSNSTNSAGTRNDTFTFEAVSEIQQGKNEYWKITGTTRTQHLPEELFMI